MINKYDYKFISQKGIYYWVSKLSPKQFYPFILKFFYRKNLQKSLNLKKPTTLSEKIQWLKLHDNNPLKTILSDKLEAKKYITKFIPELKFAKVYQECSSFKQIDFNKLPKTFVLKTNHACGTNILVEDKNKLTLKELREFEKYFKKVLNINFAYWGEIELQYKDIKPKIYAEEVLGNNHSLGNYEIWCFNGSPEFINYRILECNKSMTIVKHYAYSADWNRMDFDVFGAIDEIPKPINLNKMLNYAKILAKDFKFVRVDFFETNNILYFGEMTFTPFAGYIRFQPEKYDLIYGEKLKL